MGKNTHAAAPLKLGGSAGSRGAPRAAESSHDERDEGESDEPAARRHPAAGIPVEERRLKLAGVSTTVLEGGDGPPMVLLHGPGASAAHWERVMPELAATHRVIAPDLPGRARPRSAGGPIDADRVLEWLDELIE